MTSAPRNASMKLIKPFGTADKEFWWLFVRRFAAISTVLILVWQISLFFSQVRAERQHELVLSESLRRAEHDLTSTVSGFYSDLRILSKGQHLRQLAAGDDAAYEDVVRDFETFVSEKPYAAQLRYLNLAGQEVVRIDNMAGKPKIVPPDEMQDKSGRYYFQDAISLPVGEIYISPIDLNVERGAIEEPWRPMLRLATPIQPAGPDSKGVVILNINAAELLGQVARSQPTGDKPIQMLDSRGYWLSGVAQSDLWGFMFGHDTTMAQRNPEVWSKLTGADRGMFYLRGTKYLFRTYRPAPLSSGKGTLVSADDANSWKLVVTMPTLSFWSVWNWYEEPFALTGLLVAALICLRWSRSTILRRRAESDRQRAQDEIVRNERLTSLGSLVAGVSHELNTPIGNAVTLSSTLSEKVREFMQEVETGPIKRSALSSFFTDMREGTTLLKHNLDRANGLIRNFKRVAVDQTSEQRRSFGLSEVIGDVVGTMQPQFKGSNITLRIGKAEDCQLNSYPGPLGQVLINLITNAQTHAFDDRGGVITIEARRTSAAGIEIIVRDSGKGISEDIARNIFEPFFTTRLGAGGSGLGLSIVHNIVTDMLGGTIEVSSVAGEGTSMIVRLPIIAPDDVKNTAEGFAHVDKRAA